MEGDDGLRYLPSDNEGKTKKSDRNENVKLDTNIQDTFAKSSNIKEAK